MSPQWVAQPAMIWFRCTLVGLVTMVIGTCLYVVGRMTWAVATVEGLHHASGVARDVVTIWHNVGIDFLLVPSIFFALGFFLAYRSYSRLRASRPA